MRPLPWRRGPDGEAKECTAGTYLVGGNCFYSLGRGPDRGAGRGEDLVVDSDPGNAGWGRLLFASRGILPSFELPLTYRVR